jgi:hypothetical protein
MEKVFVTRNFEKNASEITKEEFIQMMMEGILAANEAYRAWSDKMAEEKYIADSKIYAERRQQAIDRIIENSYKKYKREIYRLRWVEKMMSCYPEVMEKDSYSHFGRDLSSIRWDIKPCDNGCSRIMSDHIQDTLLYTLVHLQCTGWSIVESLSTADKNNNTMKTPNDLFATFTELVNTARQNIIDLMKSHGVKSLNTNVYMYEYDYDLVDVSVYNIKMDCVFYEPIAMITLDEQDNIHIHGEKSGERYEPMTTDWLNIYSLVYDIFNDVDNGEIELFTDSGK